MNTEKVVARMVQIYARRPELKAIIKDARARRGKVIVRPLKSKRQGGTLTPPPLDTSKGLDTDAPTEKGHLSPE